MANALTEAQRTNQLLFALLAEFMEWHTGIQPTAEQVEKNVVDRKTATKDSIEHSVSVEKTTTQSAKFSKK